MLNPPPGVQSESRVQLPKSINPAQIQEVSEALALKISKSWVFVSKGRHMNVYFLMANIHISADNHTFSLGFKLFAIFMKGLLILLRLILQPLQGLITSTRNINCHHVEMLILECQDPPLLAKSWLLQVLKNRKRKKLRENGHSRIASRALTKIPVPVISGNLDGAFFELLLVDLGLIDAEDVGDVLLDELAEGLFVEYAADAVHIPHGDFYPLVGLARPEDAAIGLLLLQVAFAIAQYLVIEFA